MSLASRSALKARRDGHGEDPNTGAISNGRQGDRNAAAVLGRPKSITHHLNFTSGLLGDYCNGKQFKSHPLFSADPYALQINLYYDEVEVCNQSSWVKLMPRHTNLVCFLHTSV